MPLFNTAVRVKINLITSQFILRDRGGGAVAPQTKILGAQPFPHPLHVWEPKISLVQHKIGWANIQSHDLFTDRFISIGQNNML